MDTISLERTGPSQVGSSELLSGWGLLERIVARSSGLPSGRVGSSEHEGWLELTSF